MLAALVPLLLAAASGPWSKSFSPPTYKSSAAASSSGSAAAGFVLAPVSIERNDLDYDAVMANRPHLAATLGLKYDFDHLMYENWRDLLEAQDNFEARSAYAFAVLDPARTKALGSVYFDPAPAAGGGGGGGEAAAVATVQLTYWLLADVSHGGAGGLDEAVLRAALRWATTAWPFRRVLLPVLGSNTRLKELCQGALKLEPAPAVDGVPAFVYVKDGGAEGGKDEL